MLHEEEKQQIQKMWERHYFPKTLRVDPILYALVVDFKVPVQLIADKLKIRQPSVSQWINGTKKIPEKHKNTLTEMLKGAVRLAKDFSEQQERWVPQNEEEGPWLNKIVLESQINQLKLIIDRAIKIMYFYG